ncbi:tetratricopeptide repeat protein [Mangrovibacterium marinum]|uniref:histidine kinase n=1 Tax=Mangrovibacterium marinum TaxID=1639118 RepID=A0A2T5BXL4_9BACT|nr:tetratricopeptide repeat protein [Mangrovibacterium marinum]PTN05603.1 signal transduction histidine kinase [Mangrovibacterium marinum]
MKKIILIFLVFLSLDMFGLSETDSLNNIIQEQYGIPKAEAMLRMLRLGGVDDTATCKGYIREIMEIAQQNERPDLRAKAYLAEGDRLFDLRDYEQAVLNYEKAIPCFTDIDSIQFVGEIYNSIGLAYYFQGEFEKAIGSQIEAVKIYEQTGNLPDLTLIYINMGMVYNRLEDYESAIQFYRRASEIAAETGDLLRLGNSFNGLGTGHYNAGRLDSAKVYYRRAESMFEQTNNQSRLAAVVNNLGNIYTDEGDSLELGLAYYQRAYRIYEQDGNLRNQVFVMEGLGCAYTELGDYEKAKDIFQDGLKLAIDNEYGYYIIQLYYEDLARVYEEIGNIEQAYATFKNYKIYSDSMRLEERLYQAAAFEKKYEFRKNEVLISKLSAEKKLAMVQIEKDKAFRNLGGFAILILLGIITYVSFANFHRKRMNRLLTEKKIQIEAQRNELAQMNASKTKFFSIIAHDLKNPIHTVLGYSFLLQHDYDRFEDWERKRYAGDIYKSTNNIFRLLQNLLDWSRVQTGMMKYAPTVFELSSLQDKVGSLLKPIADQKNIRLNYHVPGNIHVYATPMMVETVLRNLLGNAIKFTPNGGSVSVSFTRAEQYVTCCVEDTGVGMAKEELNQLFCIDSKIKKKGTNNEDGSGLGLILCSEFIQLNKGKIWAQSELGKGTRFCFTIPAASDDA